MRRWLPWMALALAACGPGKRTFEEPVELGGVEVAPEVLNHGELAYMRYCRGCHGQHGQGDGTYASSMDPRPADLTRGEYPRLGARSGDLPSDAQIRDAIQHGIEGTGMGPQHVAPDDLDPLVAYVKTLAPVWRE